MYRAARVSRSVPLLGDRGPMDGGVMFLMMADRHLRDRLPPSLRMSAKERWLPRGLKDTGLLDLVHSAVEAGGVIQWALGGLPSEELHLYLPRSPCMTGHLSLVRHGLELNPTGDWKPKVPWLHWWNHVGGGGLSGS